LALHFPDAGRVSLDINATIPYSASASATVATTSHRTSLVTMSSSDDGAGPRGGGGSKSASPVSASSATKGQGDGTSASPAPPSPLLIGKAFIKQYYQVLSSSPASIHKFYKPTSTLSHGLEVSAPARTIAVSDLTSEEIDNIRSGPFAWAVPPESDPDDVLRFDFGRGAVDAQDSVNGGILLVASGRVTLPGAGGVDRPFVQTFFLNNSASPGKRRQFYVHNDVLRVLDEEKTASAAGAADGKEKEEAVEANAGAEVGSGTDAAPALADEATVPASPEEKKTTVVVEEAVEETKDFDDAEDGQVSEVASPGEDKSAAAASTPAPSKSGGGEKKGGRGGSGSGGKSRGSRGRGGRGSRSSSPAMKHGEGNAGKREPAGDLEAAAAAAVKPTVPGSWASLVATGGSGGSVPPSPVRETAAAKKKKQGVEETKDGETSPSRATGASNSAGKADEAPAVAAATAAAAAAVGGGGAGTSGRGPRPPAPPQAPGRNPEATLLVKNIPPNTTQTEIRSLFEPHVKRMNAPIRAVSIITARNIAFVDFDAPDVVTAILRDQEKGSGKQFKLHDQQVEVDRKSDSLRKQAGGGGGRPHGRRRSSSPGGGHHKSGGGSGGGGGKNYRRPSPRNQRQGGGRPGGAGGSSK